MGGPVCLAKSVGGKDESTRDTDLIVIAVLFAIGSRRRPIERPGPEETIVRPAGPDAYNSEGKRDEARNRYKKQPSM